MRKVILSQSSCLEFASLVGVLEFVSTNVQFPAKWRVLVGCVFLPLSGGEFTQPILTIVHYMYYMERHLCVKYEHYDTKFHGRVS